jgi:hypothetical protein
MRRIREALDRRELRNIGKVDQIDFEREIDLNYKFLIKNLYVKSLDEGSYIARYQGIFVFLHRRLDANVEAVIHRVVGS